MKIKGRKIACLVIAALLCVGIKNSVFADADTLGYNLKNPIIGSKGESIWDCIYFGKYWQNDTNGDGKADKNDKKEAIKWRVLSVNGNDAFLIADKNIESKPFNNAVVSVNWGNSTIRSWLNGYDSKKNLYGTDYRSDNFINEAFNEKEKNAIKQTTVVNEANPYDSTDCGVDTSDKIYLLSLQEAGETAYGFYNERRIESETRMCQNTAYVQQYGILASDDKYSDNGYWWLRTSGAAGLSAANVISDGFVGSYHTGDFVKIGVRPVLHLNLSNKNLWSYAGEVSSNGEVYEIPPTDAPTVTDEPTVTTKPQPTPNEKRYPKIECKKTFTKDTASKKFNLDVKTDGNGKITYKSSDNSVVKVSNSGVVSIVGCGSANITVNIGETLSYYPASANVKIKVNLEKVSNFKAKNKGKNFTCTWKKRNLKNAKCEIQASFNTKYTGKKIIKPLPALKSGKITVGAFSKKKNYYVRARAVLKKGNKEYKSAWSKNIKVKAK